MAYAISVSFMWFCGHVVTECILCSEADEIYKICSVIGSPTERTWHEGLELASKFNYQFPEVSLLLFSIILFYDLHLFSAARSNETEI